MGKERNIIWKKAKRVLRKRLNNGSYNRWIEPLNLVRVEKKYVFRVKDYDFVSWIDKYHGYLIRNVLTEVTKENTDISFEEEDRLFLRQITENNTYKLKNNPEQLKSTSTGNVLFTCNPDYTFDNFVVDTNNRFAYMAIKGVTQEPGNFINPLLIYGGTGLGKTHLIQATAHEMAKSRESFKTEYLTCEEFFNYYVDSLQDNRTKEFRKRMRSADMLLIDDIQFLAKKKKLQKEFFNTINSLYNNGKQIVLTADKYPGKIKGLNSRIVSFCERGLVVDIKQPPPETRIAILKRKQKKSSIDLSLSDLL
jgi:chromosomal replication initiator protein